MTGRSYDLVAAGAGVLFIVLGGAYLLDALDVWDAEARVVLPLLVIGLGWRCSSGRSCARTRRRSAVSRP